MVLSARVHCQESGEESSETESIYALKCHISHEVNHLHEGLKHVSDISWRSYNASSLLFVIMWSCITSNDIIVWVQHCSFNEFFPWLDLVIYAYTRVRTHTHTHTLTSPCCLKWTKNKLSAEIWSSKENKGPIQSINCAVRLSIIPCWCL